MGSSSISHIHESYLFFKKERPYKYTLCSELKDVLPPNTFTSPNPELINMTLFGKKHFCIWNYVKDLQLSSSWIIPTGPKSSGK